jgi:hypothetical protein
MLSVILYVVMSFKYLIEAGYEEARWRHRFQDRK